MISLQNTGPRPHSSHSSRVKRGLPPRVASFDAVAGTYSQGDTAIECYSMSEQMSGVDLGRGG